MGNPLDGKGLNRLLFNPTDQSKSSDLYTSQLDPDVNFSCSSTSSDYFVEDKINAKISTEHFNLNFSVLQLNARSLIRKVYLENSYKAVCISLSLPTRYLKLGEVICLLIKSIFWDTLLSQIC